MRPCICSIPPNSKAPRKEWDRALARLILIGFLHALLQESAILGGMCFGER